MTATILSTKLFIPPPRDEVVARPRLIRRMDEGRRLTLVCAPAGYGKTTLVSGWAGERPVAWVSLDEGDNDPARFMAHLVAALRTVEEGVGEGVMGVLESPQPPPAEAMLTALLNEISASGRDLVLVLDDYHVIDSEAVAEAVAFVVERMPPRMRVVIATREDPNLPLARLRARGEMTEVRAADLRFTPAEAAEFLTEAMGLDLSEGDVASLESRTEGWVSGLQLAAISMRGHEDPASFIESFTGSHRFVLDYLLEEVLERQPESIRNFLLETSVLDRMCASLCEAVSGVYSGQETLEHLERANLFVVPLDDERRWYRYHHLFADLLRQRLGASSSAEDVSGLRLRASVWFEERGMEVEAFRHAGAAGDVERAERLVEGGGMPLHFRGAVAPVLRWLESLPEATLDERPSLWTAYASVLLVSGRESEAEEKLRAAEAALGDAGTDPKMRDIVGRVAAVRATAAASRREVDAIISESRVALENLHPENVAFRTSTAWKLGYAFHLKGDRVRAREAYEEVIATGEASGNVIFTIMAEIGHGILREADNDLHAAAETYRRALRMFGDHPLPSASEPHLGLARIFYQWNDLASAGEHGEKSVGLARMVEDNERLVACEVFLARLKMVRGDMDAAASILAEAEEFARRRGFAHRIPEVASARSLAFLRRGNTVAARDIARTHDLPADLARAHIFRGEASRALAILEEWREDVEAKGWADERLRAVILQSLARHALGEKETALRLLGDALDLAEPGGFIRIFADEGAPMARLLTEAAGRGIEPEYTRKLLAAFDSEEQRSEGASHPALVEPLSERELEVLRLVARGFSNREIGDRLFLAVITVKGHNRNIFRKLGVRRRTEAVARAREMGIL